MALWPLFVGFPIFILVIVFIIMKIIKANKFRDQILTEFDRTIQDYAKKKAYNYVKEDNINLALKLKEFRTTWKEGIEQWLTISNIIYDKPSKGMYLFKSNTNHGGTTTEVFENTVCCFESSFIHQNSLWIHSFNFPFIRNNETLKLIFNRVTNFGLWLYKHFKAKEFKNEDPFFKTHKIFYTGDNNQAKIYLTQKIFSMIAEIEKKLNLAVSIEIRGSIIAIYTSGQNRDPDNYPKTGAWGEYGYLKRSEELDAFIDYAKQINKYFQSY